MEHTTAASDRFATWLDTFTTEKGLNLETPIEVTGEWGVNHMTAQNVVDAMKATGEDEQDEIKSTIVEIDFHNGDVMHFIRHLAQALAI